MKKLLLSTLATLAGMGAVVAETIDLGGTPYEVTTLIERDLGPGVHYTRIRIPDYPLNVNILQMDMNNPYNSIETTIGQETMFRTETLANAAARQSYEGHQVIGGANGNFWCVSNQYPYSDLLLGSCFNANLRNGMIATETNMWSDQWCGGYKETGLVAVGKDKTLYINNWPFYGVISSDKTGDIVIHQTNKVCRDNQTCLYNGWYDSEMTFMPVNQIDNHFQIVENVSTEIYLTLDADQQWMAGRSITFTVGDIKSDGPNGTRGEYDAVLVARGSCKDALASLAVGDKMTVRYGWSSELDGNGECPEIVQAIGGNTFVMTNGQMTEQNYHQTYNTQVYSRCAYGTDASRKKLYIIVIDKSTDAKYGISAGCPTDIMCDIIRYYGCTEMTNVDAGGSAQMLIEGSVINTTTEYTPRAVANGMFLYDIAPKDETITRLEFEDYQLKSPIYATSSPVILGYNQYGTLVDKNVQGITFSCDAELGTCEGSEFTAGGTAVTGMLTASLGDVSVSKEMTVVGADMAIRIKNLLIDATREYRIEVTSTVDGQTFTYDPAKLDFAVEDPTVISIDDNGVLRGLKEGCTSYTCTIGDFSDQANVTVEIADAPYILHNTWSDWKITGASGITGAAINDDGLISFTYGSPRTPTIKATKENVFYSLPDRLWFSFKSSLAIKDIQIDLRNATDVRARTTKIESTDESGLFDADKTYNIALPMESAGDMADLINYPLSLQSVTFTINSGSASKGEHSIQLTDLRAEYDNYAGIEDIKVSDDNFIAISPATAEKGGSLSVSAGSVIRNIAIYSTGGAMTANIPAADASVTFNVPAVASGIYLVKITTDNGVYVKKIIIK